MYPWKRNVQPSQRFASGLKGLFSVAQDKASSAALSQIQIWSLADGRYREPARTGPGIAGSRRPAIQHPARTRKPAGLSYSRRTTHAQPGVGGRPRATPATPPSPRRLAGRPARSRPAPIAFPTRRDTVILETGRNCRITGWQRATAWRWFLALRSAEGAAIPQPRAAPWEWSRGRN
jgi:hypothetical protein